MADEDKGKIEQAFDTVKAKAEEVQAAIAKLKEVYERVQAKRAERKADDGDE